MADSQQQDYPGEDGQPQQTDGATSPDPASQSRPDARAGAKKKGGRSYAAGAFDVGSGNNAALGGQAPGGAPYPTQPSAPQYGGYPQQPQQDQLQYGQQTYGQPGYPGQQPAASPQPYGNQAGYAPPAYPQQAGLEEKFGAMNMQPAPTRAEYTPAQLNRLQTSDLISQPFHVMEVDQPPPPIVLPQNVSFESVQMVSWVLTLI